MVEAAVDPEGEQEVSKLRLVVAGAGGFIGAHVLRRLAGDARFEVVALYRGSAPLVEAPNIAAKKADLLDMRQCREALEGADWALNLAGIMTPTAVLEKKPLGEVTANTILHAQLLEAAWAAGAKKYVWCSSTMGYPKKDGALREEDFFQGEPPPPYEPVGWMSRYIEQLGRLYASKPERKMTVVSLRPTGVFGEHDDFDFKTCHALPALMRRVVEGHDPIEVWGSGKDERDWVYAGDVAEACLLAFERVTGHDALNVCHGRSYDLNTLLRMMLEIDGRPDARVSRTAPDKPHTSRRFDGARAEAVLGFSARTPIEESLARTMKWLRQSKEVACVRSA